MNIAAARTRTVRWPIASTGAARGRTERAAILVEVTTDDGHTGIGEAAPLPGMSQDTLAAATAGVAALAARAPFSIEDTFDVIARFAAELTEAPSARFAIETALLGALASARCCTIADLLVSSPARSLPCAVIVETPADARRAVAAGARTLKLKVGPGDDLERIVAIAAVAPNIPLRLDANRSWPASRVRERLFALAELPIELVEEPCADAHALLADPLPCPLALDESIALLSSTALDTALASPGLAALILKPTVLGGFAACLVLAARARAAGREVIISHALEGPVGTAACAELALALGGRSAGLAPHAAIAGWSPQPPQLRPAAIVAAAWTPLLDELSPPRGLDIVVATPGQPTLTAIHDALDARTPIALLHARLPEAELDRQRALVA
ncbi:o-succinylbenzoate synthase [soil metagenome]